MDEVQRHEVLKNAFNMLGVLWESQTIQTFFPNIDTDYFAVIVKRPPSSICDITNVLDEMLKRAKVKDAELCMERDVVKEDKGRTENSPWLARTGWKEMFEGKNMKTLMDHASKETRGDDMMESVRKSVHRVIDTCMESVRNLDIRGWSEIRFWLRSTEKEKAHSKPFRKYYANLKSYADIWSQLILFCLRIFEMKECEQEFLPKQVGYLHNLRGMICLDDSEDERVDKGVLDLSISLIQHSYPL